MARSIAKFCELSNQHFATWLPETGGMQKKSVNQILSEALRYFMGERWNQSTLGAAAGVAANTVKNYLEPNQREPGSKGKEPSAKLTELAKLAAALGLEVADLVTDATDDQRKIVYRQRVADYYVQHGKMPSWAPSLDSEAQGKQPKTGT